VRERTDEAVADQVSEEPARPRLWEPRWVQHAAAFVLYGLASILLYGGLKTLPHLSHRTVGRISSDTDFFVWALQWWPHAVGHLSNPFLTRVVFAPTGFNLAWSTAIPLPSLLAAPSTGLFGSVVSFNLLALFAPTAAAWSAYLLSRRFTRTMLPAVLGGFVFGFSAYETRSVIAGHLDLSLVFVVPLIVYLVVRHLEGTIRSWPFVLLLSVGLVAQFGTFLEIFATMTVIGIVVGVLGFAFASAEWRSRILRTATLAVAAYGLTVIVVSPYLYAMIAYPKPTRPHASVSDLPHSAHGWRTELLPLVAPGEITEVGGGLCNCGRNGAYLSIPLLAILAHALWSGRRRAAARALAVSFVLIVLLSLGAAMKVRGHYLLLPWRVVGALPLLNHAAPGRIIVFAFLLGAVAMAVWAARSSWVRWTATGLAVVAMLPSFSSNLYVSELRTPPFFSTGQYGQVLRPGETVVVIDGRKGAQMSWQAGTDMYFRIAGGYLGASPPDFQGGDVARALVLGRLGPGLGPKLHDFLIAHQVGTIVAVGKPAAFYGQLGDLLGVTPLAVGGAMVYVVGS
jgi:hypothetical protein